MSHKLGSGVTAAAKVSASMDDAKSMQLPRQPDVM